jgi:hypothetical protein
MDHLQPARVDPRKQALLEARFGALNSVRKKVDLDYNTKQATTTLLQTTAVTNVEF